MPRRAGRADVERFPEKSDSQTNTNSFYRNNYLNPAVRGDGGKGRFLCSNGNRQTPAPETISLVTLLASGGVQSRRLSSQMQQLLRPSQSPARDRSLDSRWRYQIRVPEALADTFRLFRARRRSEDRCSRTEAPSHDSGYSILPVLLRFEMRR
jgi:hypothetical protein